MQMTENPEDLQNNGTLINNKNQEYGLEINRQRSWECAGKKINISKYR